MRNTEKLKVKWAPRNETHFLVQVATVFIDRPPFMWPTGYLAVAAKVRFPPLGVEAHCGLWPPSQNAAVPPVIADIRCNREID